MPTSGGVDVFNNGCRFYDVLPEMCSMLDDDDFRAGLACCACGGGL